MGEPRSILVGCLNPPAITELDASEGLPPSILLHARVYLADHRNSTTATASTSRGQNIKVSICVAAPPAISYVCIHSPDLPEGDFADVPRVVRCEKQFLLLHLRLWRPGRYEEQDDELYVYQAIPGKPPRLSRIPDRVDSDAYWLTPDTLGIYCCDGGEYILAGLSYTAGGYRLHSYSSESKAWTRRGARSELEMQLTPAQMPVAPYHKVILLGGSLLGWVDLWKGILVCDVLCQDRVVAVGYIPLPLTDNTYDHICPWVIRDVSCTNGTLKFVEIEHISVPAAVYDDSCFETQLDDLDRGPCKFLAWRATIWSKSVFSDDNSWRKGFPVLGDDILVEELGHGTVGVSTAMDHLPTFPTLSIHGDDVVHMSSSMRLDSDKTQMMSVDMRKRTLKALAPYPLVVADNKCPYFSCQLSNHLRNTPASPQVIQASNIESVNEDLPEIVSRGKKRKLARNGL